MLRFRAFQVALVVRNVPANEGDIRDTGSIPGSGRSLENEVAIHSSILAWEIPCTGKPGGLPFMGSQRVRHNLETKTHIQKRQKSE